METLGKKIRTLRRKKKLTQQALAEGLVTASMISQIESDRATPSETLLKQLAIRLGVEVDFLESDLHDKSDELQTYRSARNYLERHQYKEALELLQTLSWPLSPQFKPDVVYNEMATCYAQLGQLANACKMYEQVIQVGYERDDVATSIHGYYHAGSILRRLGRDQVARMYWQRAGDLLRQHSDMYMPIALRIYSNLGRLYLQQGNWEQSRACYEEALALSGRYGGTIDLAKTYQGLACASMQLQEFEAALVYNDRAIAAHVAVSNFKGAAKCRVNRGVILRYSGQLQQAGAYLTDLLTAFEHKDDTVTAAILHELALIALAEADYESVLRATELALSNSKITPEIEAELRYLRGTAHFELNSVEFAMREIDIALNVIAKKGPCSMLNSLNDLKGKCLLTLGREHEVINHCVAIAEQLFTTKSAANHQNISA